MANARKILIVDDDTDLRDTLMEQLSLHDEFEAQAVDTGAKGASAGKANSPDLVLMDVGLPDTMPYMPDEMTATLAGPPGRRPAMAAAKSKKNSLPLQAWRRVPNMTNMKA